MGGCGVYFVWVRRVISIYPGFVLSFLFSSRFFFGMCVVVFWGCGVCEFNRFVGSWVP